MQNLQANHNFAKQLITFYSKVEMNISYNKDINTNILLKNLSLIMVALMQILSRNGTLQYDFEIVDNKIIYHFGTKLPNKFIEDMTAKELNKHLSEYIKNRDVEKLTEYLNLKLGDDNMDQIKKEFDIRLGS